MTRKAKNPLDDLPEEVRKKLPEDAVRRMTENQTLQQSIFNLAELFAVLEKDVEEFREFGTVKQHGQTWRRAIYRAVFAWIEGVVFQIKQVAFNTQGGYYEAEFSRGEIAFLLEESHFLNESGTVKTKNTNFAEIDKNFRFAFSTLAKGLSINTKLDVGGQGWSEFKKAIQIRNRLTHPKATDHLVVTDEEFVTLITTIDWFRSQISQLIKDITTTVKPILEKMQTEGKAEQQKIVDNTMKAFKRAGEIAYISEIIGEIITLEGENIRDMQQLLEAKSKLDELKIAVVKEIGEK